MRTANVRDDKDIYLQIRGRALKLTHLNKVFFPSGFTKRNLIRYYQKIGPVVLPYLRDRPFTLRRFPSGVQGPSFFEKRCPPHRPSWMATGEFGEVSYCLLNDLPSLIWAANLAAIELHPTLARISDMDRPTAVVFDLDPGEGVGFQECCEVALLIETLLRDLNLKIFPKTSGSKGLHLYIPLNDAVTYAETSPFARWVAEKLERQYSDRVIATMNKVKRRGKILIDWSQNADFKSTVCVYSLRATESPSISAPLMWREVQAGANRAGQASALVRISPSQLFARLEKSGDLFAPVLTLKQRLPSAAHGRLSARNRAAA